MIENIWNLIYPKVCGFCDTICEQSICPKCYQKIQKQKNLTIYNYSDYVLSRQLSLFCYKGEIRQAIMAYKFRRKILFK